MTEEKKEGRGRFLKSALVVLLLAGLVAAGVMEAQDSARKRGVLVPGSPAPAFTMDKLGGGKIQLEAYKGKVVMLDFWATWCPPCVYELPELVKLAKEYEGRGLTFIAANDDGSADDKVEVALFVDKKMPGLAPYVGFATDQMAQQYALEALPTLYFIDRDGRVLSGSRGAMSADQIRRQIEAALGE